MFGTGRPEKLSQIESRQIVQNSSNVRKKSNRLVAKEIEIIREQHVSYQTVRRLRQKFRVKWRSYKLLIFKFL